MNRHQINICGLFVVLSFGFAVGVAADEKQDAVERAKKREEFERVQREIAIANENAAEALQQDVVVGDVEVFAEQIIDDDEIQKIVAAQREEQIKASLEARQKNDQNQIDLIVDDMTRVCKLDEAQVKKLGLAAKGAIDRRLADVKKELEGLAVAAPPQAAFAGRQLRGVWNLNANSSSKNDRVIESSLWKKAVEKVLTAEQKTAYEKAKTDRERRRVEIQIRNFVADLDQQLLLAEKQRNDIYDALANSNEQQQAQDQQFDQGDFVVAQQINGANVIQMLQPANGTASFIPTNKQRKQIEELLTETQITAWKPNAQQGIARFNFAAPAIQAFPAPAARPVRVRPVLPEIKVKATEKKPTPVK